MRRYYACCADNDGRKFWTLRGALKWCNRQPTPEQTHLFVRTDDGWKELRNELVSNV